MEITVQPFGALSGAEVHEILRLRALVFVVEQRCLYVDPDAADLDSEHVVGREDGRVVACARIQPTVEGQRIGRVVTAPDVRGRGLGHALVAACVAHIERAEAPGGAGGAGGSGRAVSFLHAQDHLRGFYAAHGFEAVGDVFPEDGIPHVRMVRRGGARTTG